MYDMRAISRCWQTGRSLSVHETIHAHVKVGGDFTLGHTGLPESTHLTTCTVFVALCGDRRSIMFSKAQTAPANTAMSA